MGDHGEKLAAARKRPWQRIEPLLPPASLHLSDSAVYPDTGECTAHLCAVNAAPLPTVPLRAGEERGIAIERFLLLFTLFLSRSLSPRLLCFSLLASSCSIASTIAMARLSSRLCRPLKAFALAWSVAVSSRLYWHSPSHSSLSLPPQAKREKGA